MNGWLLHNGIEKLDTDDAVVVQSIPVLAAKAGLVVEPVCSRDIDFQVGNLPCLRIKNQTIPVPDFVFCGYSNPSVYDVSLLRQLECMGVNCVNPPGAMAKTRDKLWCSQILAAHGIPVAKTIPVRQGIDPEWIVAELELPLILKVRDGSKGQGVVLVHSRDELANIIEIGCGAHENGNLLAQQFIGSSRGRDLRVLVIAHEAVACYIRRSADTEPFKSNISRGGSRVPQELTETIRDLARRTSQALDLKWAGLDFLFGPDGFILGEVNSCPGLGSFLENGKMEFLLEKISTLLFIRR